MRLRIFIQSLNPNSFIFTINCLIAQLSHLLWCLRDCVLQVNKIISHQEAEAEQKM